jgi:hypothetical protein
MRYKIEKDVPIPGPSKYPLSQMKVGDSFLAPKDEYAGLRSAVQKAQREYNVRFVTRQDDDKIRVWRTL